MKVLILEFSSISISVMVAQRKSIGLQILWAGVRILLKGSTFCIFALFKKKKITLTSLFPMGPLRPPATIDKF